MKILIIGGGAIGGFVASRFATIAGQRQDITITLAGRQSLVDGFAQHGGLHVTERDKSGNEHSRVVEIITPAASILDAYRQMGTDSSAEGNAAPTESGFDLAIFTVKSYDTETAALELAREVKARKAKEPVVLSLQNGIGNEASLLAAGFKQVIAGSITTPVSVLGPADIRIDKPNATVGLSIWSHESKADSLVQSNKIAPWGFFHELGQLFASSGFKVENYRDARSMKWTKLLMNMMGNASSAILNQPPEEIFHHDQLADMEIDAWREALSVMDAARIQPVNMGKYPFRVLAPFINRLPKAALRPLLRQQIGGARGKKMPSLHIDLHNGKGRNEVEWLNGAVVKMGQQVEVATPINQLLTETVVSLIHDQGSRTAWSGEQRRLLHSAETYRKWAKE